MPAADTGPPTSPPGPQPAGGADHLHAGRPAAIRKPSARVCSQPVATTTRSPAARCRRTQDTASVTTDSGTSGDRPPVGVGDAGRAGAAAEGEPGERAGGQRPRLRQRGAGQEQRRGQQQRHRAARGAGQRAAQEQPRRVPGQRHPVEVHHHRARHVPGVPGSRGPGNILPRGEGRRHRTPAPPAGRRWAGCEPRPARTSRRRPPRGAPAAGRRLEPPAPDRADGRRSAGRRPRRPRARPRRGAARRLARGGRRRLSAGLRAAAGRRPRAARRGRHAEPAGRLGAAGLPHGRADRGALPLLRRHRPGLALPGLGAVRHRPARRRRPPRRRSARCCRTRSSGTPRPTHHPWTWAGIHAAFVLAASLAHLAAWRLNEQQGLRDPLTGLANRTLLMETTDRLLDPHLGRGQHAVPRPRRLQGRQRLPRARGRRRAAHRHRPAAARLRAPRRPGGPHRRRRVRRRRLRRPRDRGRGRAAHARRAGRPDDHRRPPAGAARQHRRRRHRHRPRAGRRRRCCATPTWRCTWPRRWARTGSSTTPTAWPRRPRTRCGCSRTSPAPSPAVSCASTTSPPSCWPTGRTTGYEALLRWEHPERGLVSPVEFIPLAEEGGLIVEIGRWVLEQAARQAVVWSAEAGRPIGMAVNLSPRQLADDDVVATVRTVLAATGLPARQLTLEVTEGVLVRDVDLVVGQLQALRAPRCADRHRRLRDRLLEPVLPAPAARRHHQDRPQLRAGPRHRRERRRRWSPRSSSWPAACGWRSSPRAWRRRSSAPSSASSPARTPRATSSAARSRPPVAPRPCRRAPQRPGSAVVAH